MKRLKKPDDFEIQKLAIKKLTKDKSKKTIVFDLDETLIHCIEGSGRGDVRLPVQLPNGDKINADVNIRPYAKQVL